MVIACWEKNSRYGSASASHRCRLKRKKKLQRNGSSPDSRSHSYSRLMPILSTSAEQFLQTNLHAYVDILVFFRKEIVVKRWKMLVGVRTCVIFVIRSLREQRTHKRNIVCHLGQCYSNYHVCNVHPLHMLVFDVLEVIFFPFMSQNLANVR